MASEVTIVRRTSLPKEESRPQPRKAVQTPLHGGIDGVGALDRTVSIVSRLNTMNNLLKDVRNHSSLQISDSSTLNEKMRQKFVLKVHSGTE